MGLILSSVVSPGWVIILNELTGGNSQASTCFTIEPPIITISIFDNQD